MVNPVSTGWRKRLSLKKASNPPIHNNGLTSQTVIGQVTATHQTQGPATNKECSLLNASSCGNLAGQDGLTSGKDVQRKRKRNRKRKFAETQQNTDWIKPLSYHESCIKKRTMLFARNLHEKIPASSYLFNNSASDTESTRCIFNWIFSQVMTTPPVTPARQLLAHDNGEPPSKRIRLAEGAVSPRQPVTGREQLFSKLQSPLETFTKKFRSFKFRLMLNNYCPIAVSKKLHPRAMLTASKLQSLVAGKNPVFTRTSSRKANLSRQSSLSTTDISHQPSSSAHQLVQPSASGNVSHRSLVSTNTCHQPLASTVGVCNQPAPSMSVISKRQKDRKSKRRTSGELLKMYALNHQVFLFIRRILLNTVPKDLFGKSNNWNVIWKNINRLLLLGKYDKLSLGELMSGMKFTECAWVKDSHFPTCIRHVLLSALVWWLFSDVICTIIKAFFYLTDTTTYRNRIFCYRKSLWHSIRQKAQSEYYKKQLIKTLSMAEAHQKLQSGQALGLAYLRFLPKQTSFRPIINLGGKTELPNKKVLMAINQQLISLFHVLTYIKKKNPALVGSSVFGKDDIYKKWKQFVLHRKETDDVRKLYFVKLDIKNCYDSINQAKLYEIMSHLVTQMCGAELIVHKFVTVLLSAGKVKTNFKRHVCSPDDLALSFTDFVRDFQQETKLTNAVIVDQAVYQRLSIEDLLDQLSKHIFNNILMIGNRYFHMISGISQGSVLSNLLCNLYYGHMETEQEINLNKDDEILMRMVDDFLYVTPYKENAEGFLNIMIKGVPEYNCHTNPDKSLINFDYCRPGTDEKIPRVDTDNEFFPWCGLLLHTSTLGIAIDYSRYANIAISDTMTFELSRKPGEAMKQKLLNLLQPGSQLVLQVNSEEITIQNVYELMLLNAYRFHAYAKRLPYKKRPCDNPGFFERMIYSLPLSLWHRVMFRFAHDYPAQTFILSKLQVQCLCLMAFTVKLSRHHSVYKQLLRCLKLKLRNNEKRLGKDQTEKLKNCVRTCRCALTDSHREPKL